MLLHDDSISSVSQLTAVESFHRDFARTELLVNHIAEPYEIGMCRLAILAHDWQVIGLSLLRRGRD
jgi:hypothetical protein